MGVDEILSRVRHGRHDEYADRTSLSVENELETKSLCDMMNKLTGVVQREGVVRGLVRDPKQG